MKKQLLYSGCACLCLFAGPATALSWEDFWKTPHQQRAAQEAAGEYEALQQSESSQWQGVGHYRKGDFASAAEAFSKTDSTQDLYNAATALTHAGDYDAAIERFDEVLEADPTHTQAQHNRAIAEQLKALLEQNPESGDNNDPQQNQQQQDQENQNQQENEDQQQQNQESESSDSENKDQQNQQQDSSSSDQQSDAEEQDEDEQSEEQQQQQRQAEQESEAEPSESTSMNASESPEPLSEDQQAIEQWLRKIPDDPAGLLRRKLIRSHRSDYPQVGSGENPW